MPAYLDPFQIGLYAPPTSAVAQRDVPDSSVPPVPTLNGLANALAQALVEMRARTGVNLPSIDASPSWQTALLEGRDDTLAAGPQREVDVPNYYVWLRWAGPAALYLQLVPNPSAPSTYEVITSTSRQVKTSFADAWLDYASLPENIGAVSKDGVRLPVSNKAWLKTVQPVIYDAAGYKNILILGRAANGQIMIALFEASYSPFLANADQVRVSPLSAEVPPFDIVYNIVTDTVETFANEIPAAYRTAVYQSTEFAPAQKRITGVFLTDGGLYFNAPGSIWMGPSSPPKPAPCGIIYPAYSGANTPERFPCPEDVDATLLNWYKARANGAILQTNQNRVIERALALGWPVPGATREVSLEGEVIMTGDIITELVVAVGALVRNPGGAVGAGKDVNVTLSDVKPNTPTPFRLEPFRLFVPVGASIEFAGALHMTKPERKPDLVRTVPKIIWTES